MKATEQFFPLALFMMLYKMVLTFRVLKMIHQMLGIQNNSLVTIKLYEYKYMKIIKSNYTLINNLIMSRVIDAALLRWYEPWETLKWGEKQAYACTPYNNKP